MATPFITNWIKQTDIEIDYWVNNYLIAPHLFSVTRTPHLPVINGNVLRHNLTSCCPTPNFPAISFEHFPEPYYGNPDDSVEKLAVVLFYNPGRQGIDQHIASRGANSFYDKFIANSRSFFCLSTHLDFCTNTINNFWNPKNVQLNNLLNFIPLNGPELKPLFMDIIPWHSPNFRGLLKARFSLPNTIDEFKSKVIIPAALIAKNSLITRYVNSLPGKTNKIVLVAVGALYSNNLYLNQIGFNNITNTIPAHIGHVILNQRIITGNNSKITIWHISGNHLKGKLNDDISDLSSRDVYIINMWTPNIGMNIPSAIQITFNHILQNL